MNYFTNGAPQTSPLDIIADSAADLFPLIQATAYDTPFPAAVPRTACPGDDQHSSKGGFTEAVGTFGPPFLKTWLYKELLTLSSQLGSGVNPFTTDRPHVSLDCIVYMQNVEQ